MLIINQLHVSRLTQRRLFILFLPADYLGRARRKEEVMCGKGKDGGEKTVHIFVHVLFWSNSAEL